MTESAAASSNRPWSAADWEARYQARDWPWEKGEPSPGLVDFLEAHPHLPKGTLLAPGCGTGHDVRAWAQAGFRATGLDVAPSAIQLGRDWTTAVGLSADFRLGDFLRDPPFAAFDWLWEHTLFCAIHPSERDDYVRAVLRWLQPGGHYLAVNYLLTDPDGPPYPTTREEQLERFSSHFDLLKEWVPRSYPNRVGLERMFWWKRKA
jgi:SAM-dependent methyltransferase